MSQEHAIVIGAGVGGLLMARALSDTYARVTVFDRDDLPGEAVSRRGVPQGRHVHVLQAKGGAVLEELFPGLSAQLEADGALRVDALESTRWYVDGYRFQQGYAGVSVVAMTRPFFEQAIRERVTAIPGVEIVGSTQVTGLLASDERTRLTGVRRTSGSSEESVDADLVVDASGRASRMPIWLEELGYGKPAVSEVRADVVYVTQQYRYEPHLLPDDLLAVVVTTYPGSPRGGVAVRQENGILAVTLFGMFGAEVVADRDEMAVFADSLVTADIAKVVRSAEALSEPMLMRYPASKRVHYEKLARWPQGLLVTGDAVCGFNPIYGQGMTIAALEAASLRRLMRTVPADDLWREFYAEMTATIDTAWGLSTGGDLRFGDAKRGLGDRLRDRYFAALYRAATVDPSLGTAFLRVTNMVDPPSRLLSPKTVWKVLRP